MADTEIFDFPENTAPPLTAIVPVVSASVDYKVKLGNLPVSRVRRVGYSTSDTITASVVGTTETDFATNYTIPANLLVAGKVLRVTVGLLFTLSGSPPTIIFKLKIGAVVLYAGTATTTGPTAVTNVGGGACWLIQGTAAAGGSVAVETEVIGVPQFLVPYTSSYNTVAQGVNVATNASGLLALAVRFGASTAGNSVTLRQFIVEELNV
jgi:hypothetical protein